MSEDPIGLDGEDINFYVYVENDPLNWIDPEGLLKGKPGKGKPKKKKPPKKGKPGEPGEPGDDWGDDIGGDWRFDFPGYRCKQWDCNVNTPCHWKSGQQISKPRYGNTDCVCVGGWERIIHTNPYD